jgi:tetratricopeptide (TPR) repeat protein
MPVNWGTTHSIVESKPSVQRWLEWAKAHQEALAVVGIMVILLSIGIPYYLNSRQQNEKDAMAALNMGQFYLQAQVDPQKGPFKNNLDKYQEALKTFQRITTDYAGTATAKMARYYVAKCQFFSGQYPQAYVSFDLAAHELENTPLADQAFLAKVLCLEMQGQWTQAGTLYESFLTPNKDSFLVPEIRIHLANSYLKSQNKPKAIEQLKIISDKYSDTSWGKEAAWQLTTLHSGS